jgi:hypothetical protein
VLSERDAKRALALLKNPPEPTPALVAGAKRVHPKGERRPFQSPKAKKALQAGLESTTKKTPVNLGSFAKHANDE